MARLRYDIVVRTAVNDMPETTHVRESGLRPGSVPEKFEEAVWEEAVRLLRGNPDTALSRRYGTSIIMYGAGEGWTKWVTVEAVSHKE